MSDTQDFILDGIPLEVTSVSRIQQYCSIFPLSEYFCQLKMLIDREYSFEGHSQFPKEKVV
jgi:hypothetical protein